MANNKFKSDLLASIHASAKALAKVGAVDKATMKEFDEACIVKTPQFAAKEIKRILEKVKVSQPVFALYLNTSESTIQ